MAPSTPVGFPASDFWPTTRRSGVIEGEAAPILILPVIEPEEDKIKSPVDVSMVEA